VVTLHGWGGSGAGPHRIFVRLTRALAARGCPGLRFDFGGRGLSDGTAQAVTLDGMIADARAASACLKTHTGCGEIAYVGICSGGNVAIGAASRGWRSSAPSPSPRPRGGASSEAPSTGSAPTGGRRWRPLHGGGSSGAR
jgi:pimeloyl-ACP methyl ester carboxylesterase